MSLNKKVLLIGGDNNAQLFIKEVHKGVLKTTKIVGIIDNNISKGNEVDGVPVLGKIINIQEVAEEYKPDCIVQTSHFEQAINIITFCRANRIKYKIMPFIAGIYSKNIKEERRGDVILLGLKNTPLSGLNLAIKRTIDIIGSLFLTVLLSPFFILIYLVLKIENISAPALITEDRFNGYRGKSFKMLRFRTLPKGQKEKVFDYKFSEVPEHLAEIKKDERASKLGRFLRITKISELPQLFNVFLGDMSLIGPRPPYQKEIEEYGESLKKRFLVTPGMTGLWQVTRKDNLSFDDMFNLDSYYVENWSFGLDFLILLKTIGKIIRFKR